MVALAQAVAIAQEVSQGRLDGTISTERKDEIGQLLALSLILIVMGFWRRRESFWRHAYAANVAMMAAGFVLIGYQLTGYFAS